MLDDHTRSLTISAALRAAYADPALRGKISTDVQETLIHTPRDEAPGRVACALCGDTPGHGWYVNGTTGGRAPGFSGVFGDEAREPTICAACLDKDWHGRARHIVLAVDALGRLGGPESPLARESLVRAFANQTVHGEASVPCSFCSRRGRGLRGRRASVCDGCVALAVEARRLAVEAFVASVDAQRAADLRAKQAIRIPASMRAAARAGAARAAAQRLPSTEAPAPAHPGWDARLDEALAAEKPYEAVQAWCKRAGQQTPPGSAVDAMALRLSDLIEEVALAGLQRIEKTRASGEMDVHVEDWQAHAVVQLLSSHRPSPAARLRLDESILLVDEVIATGVGYQGYNGSTDFDCIDSLNELYLGLKRFL